jgi:flagellar motor switch protein FliN/FliY
MSTNEPNVERAIEAATSSVLVQSHHLDAIAGSKEGGEPVGLARLLEVPVKVTVEVGRAKISLGELVKLGPGSLVVLDRAAHEPADILVNGKIVGRGDIVTIDGRYGVRVTSVTNAG